MPTMKSTLSYLKINTFIKWETMSITYVNNKHDIDNAIKQFPYIRNLDSANSNIFVLAIA